MHEPEITRDLNTESSDTIDYDRFGKNHDIGTVVSHPSAERRIRVCIRDEKDGQPILRRQIVLTEIVGGKPCPAHAVAYRLAKRKTDTGTPGLRDSREREEHVVVVRGNYAVHYGMHNCEAFRNCGKISPIKRDTALRLGN
jgi:hypothetical protein